MCSLWGRPVGMGTWPRQGNSNTLLPIERAYGFVWHSLQWRQNEHDSVSNHQPHYCLLNRLFRRRSKKTSKLRVTGLCVGNSPGTGEFPAQRASYVENVSIWWRHHVYFVCHRYSAETRYSDVKRSAGTYLITGVSIVGSTFVQVTLTRGQ